MSSSRRPRIALLGCGTVGMAMLDALAAPTSPLHDVVVAGVAVGDRSRPRSFVRRPAFITEDAVSLARREDLDVVVEAIGGTGVALEAVVRALGNGTSVVTANKALIAAHGPRLDALAARNGAVLRYEAAAAAALPLVSLLRAAAVGDRVLSIEAVLSGTANVVLELLEQGVAFDGAVRSAQEAGYAEADPSRDLDGRDTVDKLVLLARLAFGREVRVSDVRRVGIESLTPADAASAAADGRRWKLVARASASGCLSVEPRLLPIEHPLASATGPGNVARVVLEHGGELQLHGAGAGGAATASALLRDLGEVLALSPRASRSLAPVAEITTMAGSDVDAYARAAG